MKVTKFTRAALWSRRLMRDGWSSLSPLHLGYRERIVDVKISEDGKTLWIKTTGKPNRSEALLQAQTPLQMQGNDALRAMLSNQNVYRQQ